jgi:hypothetical protein
MVNQKYILSLMILILAIPIYAQISHIDGSLMKPTTKIGDTIILDDNRASTSDKDNNLSIDKFISKSNERINVHLESKDKIDKFCLIFPINKDLIKVNEIKKRVPLWFDTVLRDTGEKSDNAICYDNLDLTFDDIYFKIEYLGQGVIKYNITADATILDPYLIGIMANSSQLSNRMPFDNNLDVVWSSKVTALSSSNTRYDTADTYSYLGECASPTYANDGDWNTASTDSNSAYGSLGCEYYWQYSKLANDTGANWQVKDGYSEVNVTIPSECWNADSSNLLLKAYSLRDDRYNAGYSYWMCYNGATYQVLREKSGSFHYEYSNIYEQGLYLTNQTNFTSTSKMNVTTEYFNVLGLVWSNSFKFWGNDSGNALNNEIDTDQAGIETGSIFDSTGMICDGNSNVYLPSMQNFSNGSTQETMCIKVKVATNNLTHDQPLVGSWYAKNHKIAIKTGNHIFYDLDTNDSIVNAEDTTTNFLDNNYHWICGTYNGSQISIYTDGVLKDSHSLTGFITTTTDAFCICAASSGATTCYTSNYVFNGTIQDVKIYNRSLSADEIRIMNANGNFTINMLNESNSSISLNGNEIIRISNLSITSGNIQKSICLWSKPMAASDMILFNSGHIPVANTLMQFFNNVTYTPFADILLGDTMITGAWSHLCYTFDGITGKLYHDGSLIASDTRSDLQYIDMISIGGENLSNPFYPNFQGSIDEYMFFAYALSAGEVSQLYHGYDLAVRDCSFGGTSIMNFTIYDEDTLTVLNASDLPQMEAFISLYNPVLNLWYNYSAVVNSNNFQICMQNSSISNATLYLNSTVRYSSENRVVEFHYLNNVSLNSSTIPFNVKLYDLSNNRSTTFLITYQDENYIYIPNAIIDLQRKYLGLGGQFYSVEEGKTDTSGQTRLHMVAEDVIYKFNVWVNGSLVYTSDEYLVLCQTAPCQVNLKKPYTQNISFNKLSNIIYSMTSDIDFKASSNIQLNYSTTDGTTPTMALAVIKTSIIGNATVCNTSVAASSGTLNCPINATYANSTYSVSLFKNNDFVGYRQYQQKPTSMDIFGPQAIIVTALIFLSLSLMAISNPPIAMITGIVSIIFLIMLNLFEGGSIFGIGSSLIYLMIAGAILIYKMIRRGGG